MDDNPRSRQNNNMYQIPVNAKIFGVVVMLLAKLQR